MSNRRKARPAPRPPDDTERAFRDALREGCPHCGSRRVIGRFSGAVWAYTLACEPDCRTFREPQLAHRVAAQAAERAGLDAGQRLVYQAIDTSSGEVSGVVRAAGKMTP
jgi:hypothetical protein